MSMKCKNLKKTCWKGFVLLAIGLWLLSYPRPSQAMAKGGDEKALLEQAAIDKAKELSMKKVPDMDWRLAKMLRSGVHHHAQSRDGQLFTVSLTVKDDDLNKIVNRLKFFGVQIQSKRKNRLQIKVDKGRLRQIASWKETAYVRMPSVAKAQEIISEAVSATGAQAMQQAGFSGKGVKIGIIDLGFFGYSLLLGSELPDSVKKKNFRHDACEFSFCPSQKHGTAVAELIHDLAPEAELYMVSVATVDEFMDAVDWLEHRGVDIVSCSLGYWLCGPVDGTGWCSKKAGEMRGKGILPVFAAGNAAKSHWFGPNKDEDGDSLIEVDEQVQALFFSSSSYQEVTVAANWNDWGKDPEDAHSDQDIDLLVLSPIPYSTEVETVGASFNNQSGRHGHMPIEATTFNAEPGRQYYIFLVNSNTNRQVTVHVYLECKWNSEITPHIEAQSILQPADSPDVLTVGAADLSNHLLDYSSHGPTWNGVVKPDVTGLSGLATLSIWDFAGTSAATPTVAGAAALLKEAHPKWGPDQLQAALELLSKDIYKPGQDNGSGCGLIDVSRAANLGQGPAAGFWWNPQKDGSGFSMERAEGTDFLAVYTYKPQQNDSIPVWFTGSGKAFSSLTGPLNLLTWTGWPLGSAPGNFASSYVAEISLIYLDETHGLLQVRDTATNTVEKQPVERFVFAKGASSSDSRTGWWWDPAFPGNGIFMDFQSGTLFGAWYHYDEKGLPRWWTFSGRLPDQDQKTLKADIIQWHGGPCLSCPQIKPSASIVGTVEIAFKNGSPSILKWHTAGGLSGRYNLERFHFYKK